MAFLAPAAVVCLALAPAVDASSVLPERHEETYCYKPEGLDHVTGHFMFGYNVTPEGRVSDVRLVYASVEPEEARNELLLSLTKCLQAWTFKPGTRDGRPATFPQLVPFHFFKPAPPDDVDVPIPRGRTIGLSRIQEMYSEKMKLAQTLLAGRGYSGIQGSGWVLRTNVRPVVARTLQEALDLARQIFEASFPAAPPLPDSTPVEIVLFRDIYDYSQVIAFDNLRPDSAAGEAGYSPEDRTIYAALGAKPPEMFKEILVHEASHHLVAMRLYSGERAPPMWANEGIACLIAAVKPPGRKPLGLASVQRGKVTGGGFVWRRSAEGHLSLLKEASKAGRLPRFEDLVDGRLDERYAAGQANSFHSYSWIFVHFLVNAEGGRYRRGFESWLLDASGDPRDAASLAQAIGRPLAEIDAALPAYIASLK